MKRATFTVEPKPKTSRTTMLRLWKDQRGLCHWCGMLTLLPDQLGYLGSKGNPSARAATLDHLYSRLHPFRHDHTVTPRHVMACSKCNGRRSKVECRVYQRDGQLEPRVYRPDEVVEEDIHRGVKRAAQTAEASP